MSKLGDFFCKGPGRKYYKPGDRPDELAIRIIEMLEKSLISAKKMKPVYVAWTNTDCTEGRGWQYPQAVCEIEATAIRLGKGNYVMGCDCPVSEATAINFNGTWLVPGRIHTPTPEDKQKQVLIDKKRAAIQRAKDAGLSEEDLKIIGAR